MPRVRWSRENDHSVRDAVSTGRYTTVEDDIHNALADPMNRARGARLVIDRCHARARLVSRPDR
jgi:hypothetical protein